MRPMIYPLSLICFVGGCVNAGGNSGAAICDATDRARTEHAAALAQDGGPRSMVTGARLVAMIDAGCE